MTQRTCRHRCGLSFPFGGQGGLLSLIAIRPSDLVVGIAVFSIRESSAPSGVTRSILNLTVKVGAQLAIPAALGTA